MLGTFLKREEFITMKKVLICVMAAAMILTCSAFAEEDPEGTPDVFDTEETAEPDPTPEESASPAPEETSAPDHSPDSGGDPLETVEPVIHGGVTASLGDDESPADNETPEPTPEVTPEPEGDVMSYEEEVLSTLGNIYGILLFFVVVILSFFVYKFFRIFF